MSRIKSNLYGVEVVEERTYGTRADKRKEKEVRIENTVNDIRVSIGLAEEHLKFVREALNDIIRP